MRGRFTDYLQNGILMEWKWVKHPIFLLVCDKDRVLAVKLNDNLIEKKTVYLYFSKNSQIGICLYIRLYGWDWSPKLIETTFFWVIFVEYWIQISHLMYDTDEKQIITHMYHPVFLFLFSVRTESIF